MASADPQKEDQHAWELKHKPQIFHTDDVAECVEVMDFIRKKGEPVAFDAEGISADGRMTLLQLCTWDRRIYLLDLVDADHPHNHEAGKQLLIYGGVKALLESGDVEKVTHACSRAGAALSSRYGIKLISTQLFDLQSADAAVQVLEGTLFPIRRNLGQLTWIYGTPQHPLKSDHLKWLTEDKEIWAKRPLPQKLIDYASYDVATLMPDLYNKLKSIIDKKDGRPCYQQIVDWAVRFEMNRDSVMAEEAIARKDNVEIMFSQIQDKYTPDTNINDLSENEINLLSVIIKHRNVWKMTINPTVVALEKKVQIAFIAEMTREVEVNPPKHFVRGYKMYLLYRLEHHPNLDIRVKASALRSGIRSRGKLFGYNRWI